MRTKYITGSIEQRFWPKVRKSDGCWKWTAAKTVRGYGVINKGGSNYSAHRLSYEINVGPIPDGMFVCHKCDQPECVRPDHLFLGTHQDNVDDMHSKGRAVFLHPKGSAHGRAKLTEEAVRDIRSGRLSLSQFAVLYGVAKTTVAKAKSGKNWR